MNPYESDSEWLYWLKARWPLALGAVLIATWGCNSWNSRAVRHPAGVLAAEEPFQENLPDGPSWTAKDHRIKALANFHIKARVLSAERYRFDRPAELSPVDFALGWGPMSDSAVLDKLSVSQSDRWFHWSAGTLPLPVDAITSHAANMHMIPATKIVERGLLGVREGQLVTLDGYLVHVDGKDGWKWQSSMTRTDSGDGACEVIWVEKLSVGDR
ncbi:MAG: hypothetical protein KGN80_05860 [Acidobacteriota bacterium]|nr:hypothetical protein [Acidobacteriota bacterium]